MTDEHPDYVHLRWLADDLNASGDKQGPKLLLRVARRLEQNAIQEPDALLDELILTVGFLFGAGEPLMGVSVMDAVHRIYGTKLDCNALFEALRLHAESGDGGHDLFAAVRGS